MNKLSSVIRRWILLAFACTCFNAAAEKPNIIFILVDDMGYGDLGCYGGKFAPTPNIDRMAREGTRLTQYYSASPICSPSRTGCLTGMYPARSRITTFLHTRAGNQRCEQVDFLDPKAPSIARTLKSSGYVTAQFGKWHMGGGRDVTNAPPFSAYGFDEHASTYESPEPHPDLTATDWIWSDEDKVKRWNRTAFFVDKTLDFLKRNTGQPCFVNLWPDDVHTPWVPEGTTNSRQNASNEKNFIPVLAELDHQIGRLFAGLKELGLDEKTLVIFTSDNGANPTLDGARSGGFRGGKGTLYEGGVRMPFIVRWPGHTPEGRVNEKTIFHAVDLFPSFCALANASLPVNAKLDGENLSAVFRGKPASRKAPIFWEFGRNFHKPKSKESSPNVAMRDGNWKLLVNDDGSRTELYNLEKDPNESRNVAVENSQVTKRLSEAALAWRKSLP